MNILSLLLFPVHALPVLLVSSFLEVEVKSLLGTPCLLPSTLRPPR